MLKVKLKLSHGDACMICGHLEECISNLDTDADRLGKLFACLYTETFLKIRGKITFTYKDKKKFSLSVAQGIALLALLNQYVPDDMNYKQILFMDIVSTIDQQTA